MQANYKSEHVTKSDLVRSLFQKPPNNPNKERDMKLVRFLSRSLFAARISNDQDTVEINDIRLDQSTKAIHNKNQKSNASSE